MSDTSATSKPEDKKPEEVEAEVVTGAYSSPHGARGEKPADPASLLAGLFKPGNLPFGLSPGLALIGVVAALLIVGVVIAQNSGRPKTPAETETRRPSQAAERKIDNASVNPVAPPPAALPGPANDVGDAIDLSTGRPLDPSALHSLPSAPAPAGPVAAPFASAPTFGAGALTGDQAIADVASLRDAVAAETQSLARALAAERAQSAEQQQLIQDLRERLEKLEGQEGTTSAGRQAAASLALLSLQRVAGSGAPFQTELDILARLLTPGTPAIDRLRPRARDGAPTLAALKLRFDATARAALTAEAAARSNSAAGGFMARLNSLVSVRPATPVSGAGAKAVIARAEDQLEKNALDKAVRELETLKGPATEAFGPWLTDARGRLAVDGAIEEINGLLLKDYTN